MDSGIVPYATAEEQELAEKWHELTILEAVFTDRELFLADLRARLGVFEGRYMREVGALYAELDEWNAQLVAAAAGTEQAQSAAEEARARADESYAAAYGEAAQNHASAPSLEIKQLYRDVV